MKAYARTPLAFRLLFLVLLSACSVKEDRKECPCFLTAVFDREFSGRLTLCGWQGTGCVFKMEGIEPNAVGEFVTRIERGVYDLSASVGYNVISPGSECDSLYLWSSEAPVDATGEELSISLDLHKQFATVFLTLDSPAAVHVSGEVRGVELFTREPIEGEFSFDPGSEDGLSYVFRLPRQRPGTNPGLELTLDSEVVIPLGVMIADAGYDWSEPSLKDIVLHLEYVGLSAQVTVLPWEEGFTKEVK